LPAAGGLPFLAALFFGLLLSSCRDGRHEAEGNRRRHHGNEVLSHFASSLADHGIPCFIRDSEAPEPGLSFRRARRALIGASDAPGRRQIRTVALTSAWQ